MRIKNPLASPMPATEAATADGTVVYLSGDDVRRLLPRPELMIERVRGVFSAIGQGRLQVAPKSEIMLDDGSTFRAMKAAVPDLGIAGVKWISGHTSNATRGLPTIHATILLNDLETGRPTAILDGSWITAARTAAASALSAEYLARADSEDIGFVACGLQARANLDALAVRFPLRRVHLFDPDLTRARAFATEIEERHEFEVHVVDHPIQVARRSDILVTSAPILRRPRRTLGARALRPGVFACLLDFDASMTPGAIARAHRFAVDDRPQYVTMRKEGYLRRSPEPHVELGALAANLASGRSSDDEVTVAMNLGIAPLDVAVAAAIVETARQLGVGERLVP